MKRDDLIKGLIEYGSQLKSDAGVTKQAAEQTVNFFEALLATHVIKPPFENRRLSDIAPNKRRLFTAKSYCVTLGDAPWSWMSCNVNLTKDTAARVLFSTRCVSPIKFRDEPADADHNDMVKLIACQSGPFFHVDQMTKPIPHELKRMRTNARYYGLCTFGVEDPITQGTCKHMRHVRAFILTEAMNEALRIFSGEVRVDIMEHSVTVYDRWFAVRITRVD